MARLAELERRVSSHDEAMASLVRAIRGLMTPPRPQRRPIGFRVEEVRPRYGRPRRVGTKGVR